MSQENDVPEEGQGEGTILDQYVPDTTETEEESVAVAVEDEEVEDTGNRNSETGLITVTCGANTSAFGEISGKSIAQLRADLADVLNIAPNAKVIVSGEDVGEDYVLQPGDRVEFVRPSGRKG